MLRHHLEVSVESSAKRMSREVALCVVVVGSDVVQSSRAFEKTSGVFPVVGFSRKV